MIAKCNPCREHAFQDSRYGENMRVFTKTTREHKYNCTVCGSERTITESGKVIAEAKKKK